MLFITILYVFEPDLSRHCLVPGSDKPRTCVCSSMAQTGKACTQYALPMMVWFSRPKSNHSHRWNRSCLFFHDNMGTHSCTPFGGVCLFELISDVRVCFHEKLEKVPYFSPVPRRPLNATSRPDSLSPESKTLKNMYGETTGRNVIHSHPEE